jgi:peptidyl-Lys metalloendopeptidase
MHLASMFTRSVRMKAFSRGLMASALLTLVAAAPLQAQTRNAGLSVSLNSAATTLTAEQQVVVTVTMTNFSAEPIQVLRWYTPLEPASAPLFNVTRNGEPVTYVGPLVKRGAPTAADYVTIPAGDSVSRQVVLSSIYELADTGVYTIEYDVQSAQALRSTLVPNGPGVAAMRAPAEAPGLVSNTIAMTVFGKSMASQLAANDRGSSPTVVTPSFAPTVSTVGCSTTRASQARTALSSAEVYARDSLVYLNAGTRGPRYTTWFGTFDANRYATVRSHFASISDAATNKPITLDCSTCPAGPNANAFAYVFANQPYKIYLCNAFWAAPNTGTDSRAGTIVHELSHFTVLGGTSDFAYGQSAARSLATQRPSRAIMNADSHEYFTENTPRQN